jgi:hypothetical protein
MSDATPSTDTFVEDIRGTDAFIEPDIRGTDGSVDAPETPGFDARRDTPAEGGSEAGDGGDCSLDPVWNAASLTFTFTSSGGFVPPPPPDAGCSLVSARYDFVSTERTLTHRGCTFTGPINRIVHLTGAQYDAILARVSALRTTCTKGCGADYPNVVLTVAASGVATTYNSNFYAGCAGSPLLPPFIAFDMLGDLHGLLNATVSAACNLDAGSGDAGEDSGDASAGSCIALPSQDAGIPDAADDG